MIEEIHYRTIRLYARSSDPHQDSQDEGGEPSVESQIADLEIAAKEIPADNLAMPYTDQGISAWAKKAEERPGLARMLNDVQPGDLVLVWNLFRLSRKTGFELSSILRQIFHTGAHVIATHQGTGGRRLELDTVFGTVLVAGMEIANAINGQERVAHQMRWQRFAARNHLWRGGGRGRTPVGRAVKTIRRGDNRVRIVVWDDEQLQIVHEFYERYRIRGETIGSICQDFIRRDIRAADGKLWVKEVPAYVKRTGKRWIRYSSFPRRAVELIEHCHDVGVADPMMLHPITLERLDQLG
jgi:site-specific DNA recombinase